MGSLHQGLAMRTLCGLAAWLIVAGTSLGVPSGLSGTFHVTGDEGASELVLPAPAEVTLSLMLSVEVSDENGEFGGGQWDLVVNGGADDALFAFSSAVCLTGECSPFAGATRLIPLAEGGLFDDADPDVFDSVHFLPSWGPDAPLPTAVPVDFAATEPDAVFRLFEDVALSNLGEGPYKIVQYQVSSVGVLSQGSYVISAGDNGFGLLVCNIPSDCVDAQSGTAFTIRVLPEPVSGLLLLASLPVLLRRRGG